MQKGGGESHVRTSQRSDKMSLLDCICCPKHKYRTAVISDDQRISSTETYGNVVERAARLARFLRQKFNDFAKQSNCDVLQQDRVVAIWSECCPEAVSGILGILSVPAVYMPMSSGQHGKRQDVTEEVLTVRIVLLHHSCLQDFLTEGWVDTDRVAMETSMLEFGFLCVTFREKSHSPYPPTHPSPHPSSPPPSPTFCCTSVKRCTICSTMNLPSLSDCVSLSSDLMTSYHSDTCDIHQCTLCKSINSTSNDVSGCTIKNDARSAESLYTGVKWNFPILSPLSLAYIMHTSGTTGRPKPVRVPHCCIVPNIVDLTRRFSMCPDDCVFNAAPLTFDPSVVEIFLALYNGACLLTVPSRVKRSPSKLANALFVSNRATILQITPSLFRHLLSEGELVTTRLLGDQSRVRILAFGGERFPSLKLLSQHKTELNSTRVFNIYGTTEVSSWSTCCAVTETTLQRGRGEGEGVKGEGRGEGEEEVPLGEAMLGTRVEVKDIHQRKVQHGYGEIYLGGGYRVCLLDDETNPVPSALRGTGDRGWVSERGHVYFAGRQDRQVKRWGHRISLDYVEQCITSHESVCACTVATVSDHSTLLQHRLLTPSRTGLTSSGTETSGPSYDETSPTPTSTETHHGDMEYSLVAFAVPQQPLLAHTVTLSPHHPPSTPGEWVEQLMTELVQSLPSHLIPDTIIPVNYLPCNQHGKVDVSRLLRLDDDSSLYLTPPHHTTPPFNTTAIIVEAIEDLLRSMLTRFTHFSNWPRDSTLLDIGATSFDVVRIAAAVEMRFSGCGHMSLLTHVLLTKTFAEVVNYLWVELSDDEFGDGGGREGRSEVSLKREREGKSFETPPSKRVPPTGEGRSEVSLKREREGRSLETPPSKRVPPTGEPIRVWRRGQAFYNGELHPTQLCDGSVQTLGSLTVRMNIKWSYNTGRCVDASPLVVRVGTAPPTVFIGSHSGVFVSLCVFSGKLRWLTQLSDRTESSACLSRCGTYVLVGCYDGNIYCMKTGSGEIHWSLQLSPEPVKSSPCVDVTSGIMWVGSHDHHLYAVDVEVGRVVRKVLVDGGSCFSSPCIDSQRNLVYIATLRGTVSAVDKNTGAIEWTFSCGNKPVFSSPTLLPGGEVMVGCVDGSVYIVGSGGNKVKQLETEQPVFSSCSVAHLCCRNTMPTPTSRCIPNDSSVLVFCGSHDSYVYCWNGRQGEQLWRTRLNSEVYSTPFAFNLYQTTTPRVMDTQTAENIELSGAVGCPCVCVCTTSGHVYLLGVHTGDVLSVLRLPGEVFSSPTVVDNHILVGCRNNRIYCLECFLQ